MIALNDFIADAEELQIKGLRGENDDDYRSEKERNDFARTAKTNPKASRLGLDQDPWSNMGLDKTKRSNTPMKRELEDKPASNDFLSNDLSEFESLIKDSDTNNLKRAKRPPKKKAKTEPLDDDSPFTADIKPKVASHKSHNLSSMNDKKDPAIFLKEISHDNLASMLDFMYQGSVDIPKSVLNDFIADAEELQIKGLRGVNDDDYRSEKERND